MIGVDVGVGQERREIVGPDAVPQQQPRAAARQHGQDAGDDAADHQPRGTAGDVADRRLGGSLGRGDVGGAWRRRQRG